MIITLIVVAFAVLALASILAYALRGPWSRETGSSVRPVDLRAMRLLIDRGDETFLRERVAAGKFKALKRQRISVTLKYVDSIARHVSAKQAEHQSACESPDPAVAHQAMEIMDLAAEIHKLCMIAKMKLTLEYAIPSLQLTPALLVPRYQAFRESVNRLTAIQAQLPPASIAIAS